MGKLIGNRYASALFEVGLELDKVEDFFKELNIIKGVFEMEDRLFQILTHPRITKSDKKSLIKDVFKDNISKEISNFLYIIIDKRRERNILEIVNRYKEIYNDHKNITNVIATTAIPMDEESKQNLKNKLEEKLNKKVEISNKVDPSIIGGVLLQMDDKIIDSTLTSQLKNMEKLVTNISL